MVFIREGLITKRLKNNIPRTVKSNENRGISFAITLPDFEKKSIVAGFRNSFRLLVIKYDKIFAALDLNIAN